MRDLFLTYGITLGRRQSRKQKIMYINEFAKPLLDAGIKVTLEERESLKKKVTNVFIGNVDKAKTIVVAGYDTGTKMLVPGYKYSLLKVRQNKNYETYNLIVGFIISVVLFMVAFLITRGFTTFETWRKVITVVADLLLAVLIGLSILGQANPVNYNKNTAANILIYQLAIKLKNNPSVAYVLTDNCAQSYFGYLQLADWLKGKADGKTFIMLDCLASGQDLFAISSDNKKLEWIKKNIDADIKLKHIDVNHVTGTPLAIFNNTILLASGKEEGEDIVGENCRTRQDYHVDIKRLEKIEKLLADYITKY